MTLEDREIYVVHGKILWNYTFLETDTVSFDVTESLSQNCVGNNTSFMEVLRDWASTYDIFRML